MSRTARSSLFRTAVGVVAICAGLSLTGCSSGDADGGGDAGTIAPVIVDIHEIDGTTVEVTQGNVIDLIGDDETYLDWTAEISDPEVVEFTPGKDDGSAQFNPGLTALSVGDTEVTLDNSTSGETVAFTVEATAAQ